MALDKGVRGPAGNYPEREYVTPEPAIPSLRRIISLIALGLGTAGVLAALLSRSLKPRR